MSTAAFFEPGPDGYIPTKWALGRWSKDTLHGPAVVALAARELELACIDASGEFLPTRLTVDLFKAAKMDPITVEIETLRDGRRIRVAEARLMQQGAIVSRTLLVLLRKSAPPPGSEWTRVELPTPPADQELASIGAHRSRIGLIGSDDTGWTGGTGNIQNASRKRLWSTLPATVVPGESLSPFQRAVIAAESTSLITNLGTDGIGYINADLTVGLSRLPSGDKIGLEADSHWTDAGISVGTATLYDTEGAFGTGMVVALNNSAAQIDFSNDQPGEHVVRD